MQVRVEVNENDIVSIKLGNPVKIHLDAYPDQQFAGAVARIANIASVQNQGTQQEVTNFEVRIQVLHPEMPVRPGMSATVAIETQTAHQVISVPIQAVTIKDRDSGKNMDTSTDDQRNEQGTISKISKGKDPSQFRRVLFVVHDSCVRMIPVEIGISDDNYIHVVSGVKAGDEVVSGPYTAIARDLDDGAAVRRDRL